MRKAVSGSLVAIALVSGSGPVFGQDSGSVALTREQQEAFLSTAEIQEVEELAVGVTESRRAVLTEGGVSHLAHLQDVDRFEREFRPARGRMEINFRDSYRYNIAGYLIDKHLGLHMVPVSVEREIDGRPHAVTWWVDDVAMDERARRRDEIAPPDPRDWLYQMSSVHVFQQLIDNSDFNTGNLLITNAWKIWMIDFTRAFRTFEQLRTPALLTLCDRTLLAGLRTLDAGVLTEIVGQHLTADEITGVAARTDLIVEHFDRLVEEKGAGAVLFGAPPGP